MTDFGLMLAGLARKKLRTILLLFAVFIAFLIYAVLAAFQSSLENATGPSSQNRLVSSNRINFTESLPIAYVNRVAQVEGVTDVSYSMWFGGYFQEERNFLLAFAVEPDSYTRIFSELNIDPAQRQAFVDGRDSILVGRQIADQYGWTLGQQIPVSSNIWRRQDGGNTWPVVVRAIFEGDGDTPTNSVYIPYEYFDEARAFAQDTIGNIHIKTASADLNDQVIREVDALFQNSRAETETVTEEAFNAAFIDQQGNLGLIILGVTGAAFVTILLIVGNAMAGAIRERTGEIAVMKTLGFTSPRIARIVIGETVMLALIGGLIGLAAAFGIVTLGQTVGSQFLVFFGSLKITPEIVATAVGLMVALGLITGAIPAWNAMRVNVITAFRRI
ncbi:FtsX-like permease family protein [bacterium]|nr:FtsX-like permease family protein [bacterium]